MKNYKTENANIPAVLIAEGNLIKPFIPIKEIKGNENVIKECIDIGYSKFIIILPSVVNQETVKNSILNSESYNIEEITIEFIKAGKFESEGEYPTTIEPVYSDGVVTMGDAVFVGPNVFIGKNCKLGDFSEISYSILLGDNVIGKKAKIENSVVRENVEIGENQIIKGGFLLTE